MKESTSNSAPPRWAESLLRLVLDKRDRKTIPGDLIEQYREVILPERGSLRANLWYLRQTLSFAGNVTLGIFLGTAFGVSNLLITSLSPLAEDTILSLLGFYGLMFALWGGAGFTAYRRSGRLSDAIKTGLIVGVVTSEVFHLSAILRVNIFLDTLVQGVEWKDFTQSFHNSGFESMRVYANYVYLKAIVPRFIAGALIGTVTGAIGGFAGKATRAVTRG